jgi:tRNA G10  N-methylase Trm11
MFADALRLYAAPGEVIADVTYGKGNFWKGIDASIYDFRPTDIATGTDFRSLPYDDASIDVVVLDPPYVYNPKGTVKASLADSYNVNESQASIPNIAAVVKLYEDGMTEAERVLGPGGRLMVKCQDQIQSNKQHWIHMTLAHFGMELGFYLRDLFVVVQPTQPTIRWPHQKHARKNHSYLWVMTK